MIEQDDEGFEQRGKNLAQKLKSKCQTNLKIAMDLRGARHG